MRSIRVALAADLRHNARASLHQPDPTFLQHDRRPPLSGKQPTTQSPRKDRRAAERRDRFDAAREARLRGQGSGARSSGGSSLLNTRTMTIGGIAVGVLIVAIVAIGQLGGKIGGTLKDPTMAYPAALLDGHDIGKATAPVTMDVYEDYQCPYCAQYALSVEPVLVSQYVTPGTLRIVHHDFEFIGVNTADRESRRATAGAVCAEQQGKYWDYAHWVYNNQDGENAGGFRLDRLTAIAEKAGLDTAAWSTCLVAPATLATVDDLTAKATAIGIVGTPTFYVNGTKISVALDPAAIGAKIQEAADAAASPAASPAASASTTP